MSTTWREAQDMDAAYDDEIVDLGDSEEDPDDLRWSDEGYADSDDEQSRASHRRQARSRRIALARRRQALARMRTPGAGLAANRGGASAVARIRDVDLDAKLADDGLRRELMAQRRRMNRSDYAAVAGLAVGQFIESFDQPQNAYARAGLRFAPLLLLSPQRRGSGVEGFVTDPRVLGGAAVLGLAFLGERRGGETISVAGLSEVTAGTPAQISAQVLSSSGTVLPGRVISWGSSNEAVATVKDGVVTGHNPGSVFITATVSGPRGEHSEQITVQVK